jgi:BirA family transcriptional regulator, biotin operon repressor / biotin---[acetyl-CoA-carboxylase] ligase
MIIGSKILFSENLPSTNSHAIDLLKENKLPEGTIVHTNYQTAGRGYSANKWESEDSKNLLLSIVLYPSFIKPEDQFLISMTISLGICDFLKHNIPACTIKWPNDIYVMNDKIAGILIESAIAGEIVEHTIVGIGLNINQTGFSSQIPNPTSLRLITGMEYDTSTCLRQLSEAIDKRYKQLIAGGRNIKNEYISRLFRLNEWSEFRDEKEMFTARILSINEEGKLILEKKDSKRKEYAFKEVEFII